MTYALFEDVFDDVIYGRSLIMLLVYAAHTTPCTEVLLFLQPNRTASALDRIIVLHSNKYLKMVLWNGLLE